MHTGRLRTTLLVLLSLACTATAHAACRLEQASAGLGATLPAGETRPPFLAGEITVDCDSNQDAFQLLLDAGQHAGAGSRRLGALDNGSLLPYRLQASPSGGEWGDAGCGTSWPAGSPVSGSGSGSLPLYAELPDSAWHVGSYSDQVTVSLCNAADCQSGCTGADQRTLNLSLEVRASCRIEAVSPADFGNVPWTQNEVSIPHIASIELSCAGDTAVSVGLGGGNHGIPGQRRMAGATHTLPYQLLNASNGNAWGDDGISGGGTFPAPALTLVPAGGLLRLDIDGIAWPAGTPPGVYSDRVTVTVEF